MRRITDSDLEQALADLKEVGQQLDIEGAEYWQVGNPFGPTGIHLLERWPHDNNAVSQSTKLGTHRWETKREAHEALRNMYRALVAARNATSTMDRTAMREAASSGTV